MTIIIDTNVAIHLRDGTEAIAAAIEALDEPFSISVVTRVELEGGVIRNPATAAFRRRKLDELASMLPCCRSAMQRLRSMAAY